MYKSPAVLVVHSGLILSIIYLLYNLFGYNTALNVAPLLWVGSAALFGSYVVIFAIAISHTLTYIVALARATESLDILKFGISYSDVVPPTEQSYFLVLWYAPAIFVIWNSGVERIIAELSKTSIWSIMWFRKAVVWLISVLIWRNRLIKRYSNIINTLEIQGFETKKYFHRVKLIYIWLPILFRSVIVESLELSRYYKYFPINLFFWHPFIKDSYSSTIYKKLCIMLTILIIIISCFT